MEKSFKRKVIKKVFCLLVISMLVVCDLSTAIIAKADEEKNEYIITFKKNEDIYTVTAYDKKAEFIDKQEKILRLELTDSEVNDIRKNKNINSVESNIVIQGLDKKNKNKRKYLNKARWNIDMINAKDGHVNNNEIIKIALIDSGVNYNNGMNIKRRINLVEGEDDISPLYEDFSGHGTSIASIIASKDEKKQKIGVDSNAEIISIKVLDENNRTSVDKIIEAIYVAINERVNIINMSFGTAQYSEALHMAIKDAYNAGILIIAAAGNRGEIDKEVEYPAAFEEVLSVGAVNSKGEISSISSSGNRVDIYAPGESVTSKGIFNCDVVCSGTSIAVPHVVGVASKIWSKDKSKTQDFIKRLLLDSANEVGETKIVDLGYALEIYDGFEKKYQSEHYFDEFNENSELVIVSDEENTVEGSWARFRHQDTIERYTTLKKKKKTYSNKAIKLMIAGIRLADEDTTNLAFNVNQTNAHGWWHAGSMNTSTLKGVIPNYFSTMEFVENVIHTTGCEINNAPKPAGMSDIVYENAKKNLIAATNKFDFSSLGYERNVKNCRYLYWGIYLHIATDLFAHRAFVKHTDGNYYYITDARIGMEADSIKDLPERYTLTAYTVQDIMDNCINPDSPYDSKRVTLAQFTNHKVYYSGRFKLQNYYEFAVESGWDKKVSSTIMQIVKDNSIKINYYNASSIK